MFWNFIGFLGGICIAFIGISPASLWGFDRYMVANTQLEGKMETVDTSINVFLVGGLEQFLFFHILGIIIPTE